MAPQPFLEEPITVSVRMPRGLAAALDEQMQLRRAEGEVGARYSRSDLIRDVLERYLEEQTFEK